MEAPLARDENGNPFELPDHAAFWLVRVKTSGRPKTVLGPAGEPLYIPILAGATALEDNGCEPDTYRLEATDENHERIVGVPVAVVELASTAIERAPSHSALVPAFLEPARNNAEALTRTIEAMQRTQLETARQQSERERWQMQAMVESQRSMALICTSLIERLKPAAPSASDPLSILKQQHEANKMIDQIIERRNGGTVPVQPLRAITEEDDELLGKGMVGTVVGSIVKPIAPAINKLINAQTYKMMGMTPEQVAAKLEADASGTSATTVATAPCDDGGQDEEVWTYRRALRQVQGELSDEEVDTMDAFFNAVTNDERKAFFSQAETIADLGERVDWVRTTMLTRAAEVSAPAAPDPAAAVWSVPPAFQPLFAQLTPAEQETAARIVRTLDLAGLKDLGARLILLPVDEQLAKIRETIQAFEQREASVAQRAVFSVFKKDAA